MTSRALQRRSAALALLVACRPIVFTLDDAGHDSETDDDTTDDTPTDGPPADNHCFDGVRDDNESDVDCGGPCPPCDPGMRCDDPSDCTSKSCNDHTCAAFGCSSDDECKTDDPCALALCNPNGACDLIPAFDGDPCDDGNPCTDNELCWMGACLGESRTCDALAGPCRTPFCNPRNGNCAVEFKDPGTTCNDGLDCTQSDTCDGLGACIGEPTPPLFETFAMPGQWQLGELWQIGPATPSMCGPPGADDPFTDHTGDGVLAGLLIGGCTPSEGFNKTCLTSPPLDINNNPFEPNFLRYWSVLSNAGQSMEASVELFDGQVWLPLMMFDGQISEKNWTEHILELPPMPPTLQLRFCQSQKDVGVVSVGGWSIDDVTVGPAQCLP